MSPPRPDRSIAFTPTPLHRLNRLSDQLGHEVWTKRDDLTGLGLGGNKARKLAYLVAEARALGADALVTAGAAQSNHARMTAAAAAMAGMECHLVLGGPPDSGGNVLLDRVFGAEIHWSESDDWSELNAGVERVSISLEKLGNRVLAIPMGGATPVGCLGYVDAATEISRQLATAGIDDATLFFASGTGGTHAGLLAGMSTLEPESRFTLHAVAVAQPHRLAKEVARLATATCELAGLEGAWRAEEIDVDTDFFGGEYAKATPGCLEAIKRFGAIEGLALDPAYTAKAADALLTRVAETQVEGTAVFLHTGGSPAIFARSNQELITDSLDS